MQLQIIGVFLLTFAAVVIGFMWFQVRAGRWAHVDASGRSERLSLNVFLVGLLVLSAVVLRYLLPSAHVSIALALAAMLVVAALLLARWVKVSLHTAFAAYSTALLWPLPFAVVAGIIVTAAVAWSRLALGRHVATDIGVGFLLGVVAGTTYDLWIV
jgi:membrane-associated phospholipid phosphatase